MIKLLFLLTFLTYFSSISIWDQSYTLIAIKPSTGKSRFGDCLCMIYMANCLSSRFKLPIIYQDFTNSNELEIQKTIDILKQLNIKNFRQIKIKNVNEINLHTNIDTMYLITMDNYIECFLKQQNNYEIKKIFKKLIKPIYKIQSLILKDHINIAIHVRKGGGFDLPLLSKDGLFDEPSLKKKFTPVDAQVLENYYKQNIFLYSDQRWPLKFPPDSFYVDQIKKIISFFLDKKIHVYIFTDDLNPQLIAKKYTKAINNTNVKVSYRKKSNHHTQNITQDFFAMTEFDCLIRPCSTYSENVQMIGNFKLVIYPKHGIWIDKNKLIIDQIYCIRH